MLLRGELHCYTRALWLGYTYIHIPPSYFGSNPRNCRTLWMQYILRFSRIVSQPLRPLLRLAYCTATSLCLFLRLSFLALFRLILSLSHVLAGHLSKEVPHHHQNNLDRLAAESCRPDKVPLHFVTRNNIILNIANCTDIIGHYNSTTFSTSLWIVILWFNVVAAPHCSFAVKLTSASFDLIATNNPLFSIHGCSLFSSSFVEPFCHWMKVLSENHSPLLIGDTWCGDEKAVIVISYRLDHSTNLKKFVQIPYLGFAMLSFICCNHCCNKHVPDWCITIPTDSRLRIFIWCRYITHFHHYRQRFIES